MTLEEYKREKELEEKKLWKSLTPYQKHITMMYFYRIRTDFDNIASYLETRRFHDSGICPTDLPTFIFKLSDEDLRAEAYEVIGQRMPA